MACPAPQPSLADATTTEADVVRFFREIPKGLVDALPTGVCVTFELHEGDWARSWTVRRDEAGVGRILARAPSPCDCRLSCSASDFLALVSGSLAPRQGFLEGRFEVEGDVGLVLQLHRCL